MRAILAAVVGVITSFLVYFALSMASLFLCDYFLDQQHPHEASTWFPIATLFGGLVSGLICRPSTCRRWWQSLLISPGLYFGVPYLFVLHHFPALITSSQFVAWSWAGAYTGLSLRMTKPMIGNLPSEGSLPTRLRRLAAVGLDFIIAVLAVILLAVTGISKVMQELAGSPQTGGLVNGLILSALLYGYTLQTRGQTPGKLICRIRISSLDGTVPPLWRSLVLRYWLFGSFAIVPVVGLVLCLLDVLFIFRKDRRCLHDLVARTIVLDSSSRPSDRSEGGPNQ